MMTSPKHAILCLSLMLLVGLFASNTGFSANLGKDDLDKIKEVVYPLQPLVVHGTEYKAGEIATIFLQLKDVNNFPIMNGSCYLDMFAPNKSVIYHDAPMLYLAKSDGLYFYDYNLPASTGLYMVSAQCTYSLYIRHYYTLTAGGWNPFEATSCGSNLINITTTTGLGLPQGSPIQLNNLMDWAYVWQQSTAGGGTKVVNMTFVWNASQESCKINKTNSQSLAFYYMGETAGSVPIEFYAWNWNNNTWKSLGTLTSVGKASTTATSGIEDYFSAKLDITNKTASDGSVKIMLYASSGSGFSIWLDWFGLVASTNTSSMIDLKGSGEIHLSGSEGIYQSCSILTNKDSYFPNEAVQATYFSGTSPTRFKIILQNGSVGYDTGLFNGTGTFMQNFSAPSQPQSVIMELLCGNSFAHKNIVIAEKGYWDIDWKPILLLVFALAMIAFILIIRR